jgi:hypothetical protein
MRDWLKNAGGLILAPIVFVMLLAIPALFIVGAEKLSIWLLPWLMSASALAMGMLIIPFPLYSLVAAKP